ncbi:TPA: hypothetical protein ACHU58_000444 [Streptococcus suis]
MQFEIKDELLEDYSREAIEGIKTAVEEFSEALISETDKIEKKYRSNTSTRKDVTGSHVIRAQMKINNEYIFSDNDKKILGALQISSTILSILIGFLWTDNFQNHPWRLAFFIIDLVIIVLLAAAQFYYSVLRTGV